MSIDPSKVQVTTSVCDLEEGHPVNALFLWFPQLQRVAPVCDLFRLMHHTYGDRLGRERVRMHQEAAEKLLSQEWRCLLDRFQQECPFEVIDNGEVRNLYKLFSRALSGIERGIGKTDEASDAKNQVMTMFCQLLLAIGLSPTAP